MRRRMFLSIGIMTIIPQIIIYSITPLFFLHIYPAKYDKIMFPIIILMGGMYIIFYRVLIIR